MCRMSALGQKQTCAAQNGMSALPPNSGQTRVQSDCPLLVDLDAALDQRFEHENCGVNFRFGAAALRPAFRSPKQRKRGRPSATPQ